MLQDLKQAQQEHALLFPWQAGVSVHTGFLQQLLGALGLHAVAQGEASGTDTGPVGDTLLRAAARLTGGASCVGRVVLCGHSLGGAVATLGT